MPQYKIEIEDTTGVFYDTWMIRKRRIERLIPKIARACQLDEKYFSAGEIAYVHHDHDGNKKVRKIIFDFHCEYYLSYQAIRKGVVEYGRFDLPRYLVTIWYQELMGYNNPVA